MLIIPQVHSPLFRPCMQSIPINTLMHCLFICLSWSTNAACVIIIRVHPFVRDYTDISTTYGHLANMFETVYYMDIMQCSV